MGTLALRTPLGSWQLLQESLDSALVLEVPPGQTLEVVEARFTT